MSSKDIKPKQRLGQAGQSKIKKAILIVVLLQLVVIYLPVLESFFHVDPLTALELLVCIVAGSLAFWAIELEKWWLRTKTRRVY